MRLNKDDKTFLSQYDASRYDRPSLAVDIVIFTIADNQLKVLSIKRGTPPFSGKWALPGGFLNKKTDGTLEQAALRELREETGAQAPYLEQLYTFGGKDRDPRDWTVSVAYFALMPMERVQLKAGSDASSAAWYRIENGNVPIKMAFDHNAILSLAVQRLRSKLEYTAIAGHLLGEEFTLPDLQNVYEIVLGEKLDKSSFRRGLERADVVSATGRMDYSGGHRPAKLYRFTEHAKESLFFPRSLVRSAQK